MIKNRIFLSGCSRDIEEGLNPMPSPTPEEMDSPEFNAIWDVIKNWDIKATGYHTGYTGGNGSHVKLILDSLKPAIRESKINDILDEH